MVKKTSADSGFDKVSWIYYTLANVFFFGRLKKSQEAYLDKIPKGSKVLVIGGGNGAFLKGVDVNGLLLEVDFVEASPNMLKKAKKKLGGIQGIRFIEGTEKDVQEEYDVVITNYFLDVFEKNRLEKVVDVLLNSLRPHGIWLLTDFQNRKLGWFGKMMIKALYLFFGTFTGMKGKELQDFQNLLVSKGLAVKGVKHFYFGMLESGILMRDD